MEAHGVRERYVTRYLGEAGAIRGAQARIPGRRAGLASAACTSSARREAHRDPGELQPPAVAGDDPPEAQAVRPGRHRREPATAPRRHAEAEVGVDDRQEPWTWNFGVLEPRIGVIHARMTRVRHAAPQPLDGEGPAKANRPWPSERASRRLIGPPIADGRDLPQ